ncbi:Uroporphyrinogen decarboxylase (URO-D) [Desulfotomaculum arcticum]|uniref:Uroporphyrinogen decarboxylase (URO-D) n=1 Tax=Desulfotruncus arcticus DSM 17038 TaxID=1121424 RepID=A0A1I2NZH6_9FIRM|nr:uroporphyrinogen decarboxylase family protein [Desulfotruncus arcticus]SFG08520.1 Uroporphyrinogen decarboxylase (URO-D) [Desulfotomaculum arcticum] [Desulfotruncus arcticus DSM 17038]
MTNDAGKLQQERYELFDKLFTGQIPKRVPLGHYVFNPFAIQFAGYDLFDSQWDTNGLLAKACDEFCSQVFTDIVPVASVIVPYPYQVLKSRSYKMSKGGFMQHPEISGMDAEDYDAFIKNPFDVMLEKILPTLFPALDTDPVTRSVNMAKGIVAYREEQAVMAKIRSDATAKYGYLKPPANSSGGGIKCPFDFLADFIRGFGNILIDCRRHPEQVIEACDAVFPLLIRKATPSNPHYMGTTSITTHMPGFMRTKDFEKFYYPTFKKMIETFVDSGMGVRVFCEGDWMRYLDHLRDLPENVRLRFEYGDPKIIKEKLGDKHIISGLYPISILQIGTKEEVINKAKEYLDILAPGGRYYFEFDKSAITCQGNMRENIIALSDYLRDNATY